LSNVVDSFARIVKPELLTFFDKLGQQNRLNIFD
jgi:hypothetical protein